ncbi:MAG: CBS domain-containing protein [Chloroflexi bacterium]|nr:CBS domain-containing protein [Chloroflexota bacterium]
MNVDKKTVGEIVAGRSVYFVLEDSSVLDVARYMTEHQIGAVSVLDKGYQPLVLTDQVGIFSERDLMTRVVAQGLDPASTKVSEVMTKKVAVLSEDHTYKDALSIMEQLHIRHLPVMVGKRMAGCVSIRDLREAEAETHKAEVDFLDDYIQTMEEAAWA